MDAYGFAIIVQHPILFLFPILIILLEDLGGETPGIRQGKKMRIRTVC